jgi:hypothetical protein
MAFDEKALDNFLVTARRSGYDFGQKCVAWMQ